MNGLRNTDRSGEFYDCAMKISNQKSDDNKHPDNHAIHVATGDHGLS